jgi:hypothetical protein
MNGRRAIVGLCMLCALVFSAFAAQGAAAATKGTTAFTCVKEKGTLRGEHCLTTGSASPTFGHVAIAENTTTELSATNAKTASETTAAAPKIFKFTLAGVPLELQATGVSATGSATNKKAASGEHYFSGTGTITYTGVTVLKPAGQGCKVTTDEEFPVGSGIFREGAEGVVHTKELKFTTEGQEDFLKFEPASGTVFATFWVTCTGEGVPEALKGTYTVTGSVKCPTVGATIVCTHEATTALNTLKVKGLKAGLEGSLTVSGRSGGAGAFTPLSNTTVETP